MADYTPSRPGQQDGSGDADALFLKVYAGEVLTAFNETNVMADKTVTRSISSGKSAQFPATWKTSASYHTPGNELTGSKSVNSNERVITIDDLLVSDIFVANIDEAKSHFDVRAEYSKQQGDALAKTLDQNLLQLVALGARSAATVSGGDAGLTGIAAGSGDTSANMVKANGATTLADLVAAISYAAQNFDEKDIPEDDRFVAVKPAQYHMLAGSTTLQDKDYGGAGSILTVKLPLISGMSLVKSNNVPTTTKTEVSGTNNTYHGDFQYDLALCWHRTAVGTVKLMDLAIEKEYQISRQGTLLVAKYAMGHGILRPECCAEIVSDDAS